MARKPSDDVRDAKRELKIKNQQFDWLKYNNKGESKGWSTDPTVGKSPYKNKPNPDGFRIDWDEKHHLQGLNLYDVYTQGMTPKQIKATDERLAKEGMYKGNNGLNRIDIPRRLHHSSKYPEYEGAHQQTMREAIDSKGELNRLNSLSPDQRFAELEGFVTNQARHRKVGQQKFMEQFLLEPGNDSSKNVFGGNFSQAILQNRDKGATAKAGAALRQERQILKSHQSLRIPKLKPKQLAQLGLALPSVFGVAASATETTLRTDKAAKSGSALDWLQAGLSGASLIADGVPVAGELVSTPADATNVFIDSALEPRVDRQQLLVNQVDEANRIKNKPQPLPTNRGIRFEQNGKPITGKAILNGKEITVPYGSVAGEGKNFAQKAWDSFNSLF
jgi:curved DNA-binding protein CbpA